MTSTCILLGRVFPFESSKFHFALLVDLTRLAAVACQQKFNVSLSILKTRNQFYSMAPI